MIPNHASAPARSPVSRFLYLLVVCLVAALGGLLFGFDTAVISGTVGFFQKQFALTPAGTFAWPSDETCVIKLCAYETRMALR